MSGVCAIVSRTDHPVDHAELDAMVAAAPHRSTSGDGRYGQPLVALAQLSRSPAQPTQMTPQVDHATGVVVVADARIDNSTELRATLGRHAPDPGAGAAALVLAAYLRWGHAALPRLIGDFAIVIWDPRDRSLLLARDPFAMRALYYHLASRRVLVATEAKQLLAGYRVPDAPDERTLGAFLCGSFGSLDWSYYASIAQVAPGHGVLIQGTSVRSWRFWDIDPGFEIHHPTIDGYREQLRELFLEAVRVRLRPDQPVGVLLSGGIDSGAVASAAGWLLERQDTSSDLRSYSWDFGSLTMCDERETSQHIVDRYGIAATDVSIEDAGPLAGYPDHAPDLDDPFHGHFQTMLDRGFAAASADGVGPLFTGMRGDLAIGPVDEDYETLFRAGRLPALAGELRRHHLATGESMAAITRRDVTPMIGRLARRSRAANWARWAIGRSGQRPRPSTSVSRSSYPRWIEPGFARRIELDELIATYAETPAPPVAGPLRKRRYEWLFMPMHLRWAVSHERRVAGFGMEAVDPWSDRRIAEFCVAVPQQVIDQPYSVEKQLVRDSLKGVMPKAFLDAAGKTVPTALYRTTLRGPAAPIVEELLADSHAESAGWIRADRLRDDYEHFRGGGPPVDALWWTLSAEWWLRQRSSL